MATKKRIDGSLRGAPLVKRAIEALAIRKPRPVPAATLAALTLGGKPLPESLRSWLAHHSALPRPFSTRLLEGDGLALSSWVEIVPRALARPALGMDALDERLPGRMLPLDVGDEQFRVVFVGAPDAAGEYPVFDIDAGDVPVITLAMPGFDVWLAVVAGLVDARKVRATYGEALAEHAKNNLAGAEAWQYEKDWKPERKAIWQPPPYPKPRKGPADPATELVEAVREGRVDEARELLDEGLSPTSNENARGQSALNAAANCAQPEILALLLDRGAAPDARDDEDSMTPLQIIANMDWWWYAKAEPQRLDRWLSCVRLLLARGADREARDDGGRTPLQSACRRRSFALVSLLIEHGADVNARGHDGLGNALHALLQIPGFKRTQPAHDVIACLELLSSRGIDPNVVDAAGDTPLHVAARDPGMPREVFESLTKSGARDDVKNGEGKTWKDVARQTPPLMANPFQRG